MSRKSGKRGSILDNLAVLAEMQQADAEDGLISDDELLLDDEDEDEDDVFEEDEDEDDEEEDDDDDDELDDEEEDEEHDDEDDTKLNEEELQMILNEELASEVRLLGDGELEEILDQSLYQYGPQEGNNYVNSNSNSAGTPEDMDHSEVWDTPTPLEDSSSLGGGMSSQAAPGSRNFDVFQGSTTLPNELSPGKRQSFVATRRSVVSENNISVPATPSMGGGGGIGGGGSGHGGEADDYGYEAQPRRKSLSVPVDQSSGGGGDDKRKGRSSIRASASGGSGNSRQSSRRSGNSIYRSTRPGSEDDSSSTGSRPFGSRFSRQGSRQGSRAVRNGRSFQSSNGSGTSSSTYGLAAAADLLGKQDGNSAWENIAAAATVVAATTATGKRSHVQFGANDYVLVLLSLMNLTNHEDDRDTFTIDAVNTLGYPVGGGTTEAEKQGPFTFVMATVTNVHFDEDERYYTVRRFDTGTEQRADSGWMEPIKEQAGIDAAVDAARRTTRSTAEDVDHVMRRNGLLQQVGMVLSGCVSWPARFARTTLRPFYKDFRVRAKKIATASLHGDKGYAYRVSCTSINFLVLCSFTYLFLEPISLAFLPVDYDFGVAVTVFVVWVMLGLELLFEYLIRPADYNEMITSDKAFAPSTARHINSFHLFFESLSLLLFIPQLPCVFSKKCGESVYFSAVWASIHAVTDKNGVAAAFARFCLGLNFLKAFGLFRHWKQMWINRTFERGQTTSYILRRLLLIERKRRKPFQRLMKRKNQGDDDADETVNDDEPSENNAEDGNEEDQGLKNAATIGTSLMVVNSHRALFILLFILTLFPAIYSMGRQNPVADYHTDLLQANNLAANTSSTEDCAFLLNAVTAWLMSSGSVPSSHRFTNEYDDTVYLMWGQVLPIRCPWQNITQNVTQQDNGVITLCPDGENRLPTQFGGTYLPSRLCDVWSEGPDDVADATTEFFADEFDLRVGGLSEMIRKTTAPADFGDGMTEAEFYVKVIYNGGHFISLVQTGLFILLVSMLVLGLLGLTAMRGDAGRLVLDPLQRMLKIVVRYAENPLSHSIVDRRVSSQGASDKSLDSEGRSGEQLGNYETEQLINAIAKIADLLRKCWGVAGAGIISSNLARTKEGNTVVFNPTVPGKRVYALFGFVAINDFSNLLRALDRDVMILINDVSRVVHDEVYRWSLGGSGQCNKNLGAAFLMVFRIGDFHEVHAKQKQATAVVFDSQMRNKVKVRRRRSSQTNIRRGVNRNTSGKNSVRRSGNDFGNDGTLQLASLPGIQSFTDRALLGMLKSFAGIHRDKKLFDWQKDFRLGAGVGNFTASVIYGMDAGWAVEGAVGSEYKIDATYLSPHVNMASRMCSATKQYNVTILLSQAVEELLSKPARSKLRHLDTVFVKGSSVEQRIFTFDARYEGVDFFLLERSPEQADYEADSYNTTIWETDQDLRSMRQHITDEFTVMYKKGVEQYLAGEWKSAIDTLRDADDLMIQCILEEGYIDYRMDDIAEELFDRRNSNEEVNRIRQDFGDGACKCLVSYMVKRKGIAPDDWKGVRVLTSK